MDSPFLQQDLWPTLFGFCSEVCLSRLATVSQPLNQNVLKYWSHLDLSLRRSTSSNWYFLFKDFSPARFVHVRNLDLKHSSLSNATLTNIIKRAPNITSLNISHCKNLSPAGLVHLKNLRSLTSLNVMGVGHHDWFVFRHGADEVLSRPFGGGFFLNTLPPLKTLKMGNLPALKEIEGIKPDELAAFACIQNLRVQEHGWFVTLAEFKSVTSYRTEDIISLETIQELARRPHLQRVEGRCHLTFRDLEEHFCRFPNIESLPSFEFVPLNRVFQTFGGLTRLAFKIRTATEVDVLRMLPPQIKSLTIQGGEYFTPSTAPPVALGVEKLHFRLTDNTDLILDHVLPFFPNLKKFRLTTDSNHWSWIGNFVSIDGIEIAQGLTHFHNPSRVHCKNSAGLAKLPMLKFLQVRVEGDLNVVSWEELKASPTLQFIDHLSEFGSNQK